MSDLFNVSSSPHVRAKVSTNRIMLYVIISLLPATIFGIVNFGARALLLIVATIIACVLSEWIFEKIVHKKSTISDLSAVVTGLLLALNLPSTLPVYQAVIGGVFAIVVVKMLFGGLGQNFMNPALGARCFLLISFTGSMTSFTYDGVSGATPLAIIKDGGSYDTMSLFLGTHAGTIGETSILCLLIGAIFLLAMGVIDLRIPGTYLITFVVFIILFSGHGLDGNYIVEELCSGGIILGAFFMATDYVTSPITPRGKIVFGICLGCLTGIFRLFGASAEGVSYSIIFANMLVPLIERVTIPNAFGVIKEKKKKEAKANE
ncbi:RnfABCDGE type electron transport complex subunit D [Eubacterium oxidoreducens]|uniref:Ion-translocating oxidoreductase complex subunit D n=1 Tax=Eubacterium oxidoreducens TaxID=1732 RepID=A0A1G6AN70_EUBOX|nr:RnfABCDGE type electron transport complex subunit D [Eubacterium oxidoreducens]SDB09791.1 electron transport complex protein RnfD [Eubacterium oxidoreducens]